MSWSSGPLTIHLNICNLLVSHKFLHLFIFLSRFFSFWWHKNTHKAEGLWLGLAEAGLELNRQLRFQVRRGKLMTDELLSPWWATFPVNPGFDWALQCLHTSLMCFSSVHHIPSLTHLSPHVVFPSSLRPDTFYSSLSYLCLHLISFL